MEIQLPEYPASAGPAAAKRVNTLRERSAAARATLQRELDRTVEAFDRAFEVTDRQRTVRDRIADAARANTQRVPR
ncbi:hypothetical protein FQ330_03985 [Agrococcus sediminis]|uniref:Uncharacterized protein n=1 Tax=Agrococcus sediminis TaxID=2599924 RepID=A0A5M8QJV2_9MICO|nr:hypothetical protein [Agrococcus sediminis]KAA6434933.1 hypothetical protein FQ330_03985 [Agrococcus sediminis]